MLIFKPDVTVEQMRMLASKVTEQALANIFMETMIEWSISKKEYLTREQAVEFHKTGLEKYARCNTNPIYFRMKRLYSL